MNKMFHQIEGIFNEIELKWKACSKEKEQFARICYDSLEVPIDYSLEQVKEIASYKLPKQSFERDQFGEIPFTLFSNDDFFIDMYVWNMDHACIHDHNFTGAFKVLSGQATQLQYQFKVTKQHTLKVAEGITTNKTSHKLLPGTRQKILPYNKFIHQVFHFVNPTVTLVARDYWYDNSLSTYSDTFAIKSVSDNIEFLNRMKLMLYFYLVNHPDKKLKLKEILELQDDDFYSCLSRFNNTLEVLSNSKELAVQVSEDFLDIIDNSENLPSWLSRSIGSFRKREKIVDKINKLRFST